MARARSARKPAAARKAGAGSPPLPKVGPVTRPSTAVTAASGQAKGAIAAARQPGFFSTASGFLLGALFDVLVIQYIRGGSSQVRQWFRAKFLNEAGSGAAGTNIQGAVGAVAG